MIHKKIQVSVVIPVFNSKPTIDKLYNRLNTLLKKIRLEYEIIFVDDGSMDGSWNTLNDIYRKDPKTTVIQLNRNFGQHNALMCGFRNSKGKFIITLDDDLQNPPEEIPKLIAKIEEGYDIVYGEYITKKHSLFRNSGSDLIQFIYKKIFQVKGNLTAFRIVRRSIIKEIIKYQKNYTFIDGLIAWQTRNIGYVQVRHGERLVGNSGYNLRKLFVLSLNMISNFSIFPLQLASIMGFSLSFLGLVIALFYILKKIFYGIPVTGFASIIVSITLFSGAQLITIGLIGEYIGRIHLNINNKPQYTIKKKFEQKNK